MLTTKTRAHMNKAKISSSHGNQQLAAQNKNNSVSLQPQIMDPTAATTIVSTQQDIGY